MNIPLITASYLAAAISFAFLGLSLLTSWRGQYRGVLLTVACFVTAAWAGLNAFAGYNAHLIIPIEAMEVIKTVVWLLFIWEVLAGAKAGDGTMTSRLHAFRLGLISVSLLLLVFTIYIHAGVQPPGQSFLLFDITGQDRKSVV